MSVPCRHQYWDLGRCIDCGKSQSAIDNLAQSPPMIWLRIGLVADGPITKRHLPGILSNSGKRHQADNLYGAMKSDTSSFVIVRE